MQTINRIQVKLRANGQVVFDKEVFPVNSERVVNFIRWVPASDTRPFKFINISFPEPSDPFTIQNVAATEIVVIDWIRPEKKGTNYPYVVTVQDDEGFKYVSSDESVATTMDPYDEGGRGVIRNEE